MGNIQIIQVKVTDKDYQKVYDLREEILRKPIGLSLKDEDLSGDALDHILIAKTGKELIGCVMLHPTEREDKVKLRQMAVAESWQGKGIGRLLVEAAEHHCRRLGINKIVLHARITAEQFYSKLGYKTVSEEFTEVGIPHVIMEKNQL
jgi:predicted GNAT family N-acyltransferase